MSHPQPKSLSPALMLAAIGVVYGDIGTSPLYAVKEIFLAHLSIDPPHVLGALSLIFWSLTLVVTTKYAIFIMRADNKGEGGIMALLALALQSSHENPRLAGRLVIIGLIGTVLFYGDSIITPAISVLSAVEGLQIIAPQMEHFVIPATLMVLSLLFIIQAKGTAQVGRLFGPIMVVWFLVLALMGMSNIINSPQVLAAVNPWYGLQLMHEQGWHSLMIMGSVVLAVTGAEALYADMGHFGLRPVRMAWFSLVFPALLINYFGQGALLIQQPQAIENPFYLMAPGWALKPLLILSTLATVIASQAVISGAFSLTRQAIQLGYVPRMEIHHTSGEEMGQIYIPAINWLLMFAVFVLVMGFKTSSSLASAYGLAVTGTMIATTLLAYVVIKYLWHWPKWSRLSFLSVFLSLDLLFFSSNSLKIPEGGWLPLLVGLTLFLTIHVWKKGRELLSKHLEQKRVMFEELEQNISPNQLATVPGTAIYLARTLHGVPQVLLHNLEHNHVLHEKIIVLTIVTKEVPYVDEEQRIKVRVFGNGRQFFRVKMYFGFQEQPDMRRALRLCANEGLEIDQKTASFFIGSESIRFRNHSTMPKWQRPIFRFLIHNAYNAVDYFKIPVERVTELGMRIEL